MNILITAGNTQAPIDRVRCITNIFTGRTGAAIALEARRRGHAVTLLTSHPETLPATQGIECIAYRTFEDLRAQMSKRVNSALQVVIHSAAVSDYLSSGIYAAAVGSHFDLDSLSWRGQPPTLVDRSASKVKSDAPELWLRLERAPKLIDLVRTDWGFRGFLVKFKLEVGVSDADLLTIAEKSRLQSDADWMVANTLEGASEWAFLGSAQGYERIARAELPWRLLDAIEYASEG